MPDVGYYTLPVILSFEGVDKQVNGKLDKAFGDVGKNASTSLAKGASPGLKALETDVNKAAEAYSKMRDKAEDSIGKVRTAEASLAQARNGSNPSRIIAAEEKLATARRNSTRAVNDAKSAYSALEGAQGKLGSGTSDLGGKLSGLESIASKAGTALAGAGVIAAGAATVGIAALAAGVVVAGRALYDLGSEFDDTFDNIRIKTGATGDQLKVLEDQTKRLAPTLALNIGDIGNVVALVKQDLHLLGTESDNVVRAIADAGRLTGEAIDVKGFSKVATVFKIGGKDMVGALNQLFTASQQTQIPINTLMEGLVKAGPELTALKLPLGEAATLMAQLEDSGLAGKQGVTALTAAQTESIKEGKDFNVFLSETIDKIKDFKSDADATEFAGTIFGKNVGDNIATGIRNGTISMEELQRVANGTGDTIAQAANDTDDWAEKWTKFKNSLKVGLEPIGTAVFNSVNTQLGNLSDWVTQHKPEVIEFFTDVGVWAINAAASIGTFAASSLRQLGSFIKGVQPIIVSISNFIDDAADIPGVSALFPGLDNLAAVGKLTAAQLDKVPPLLDKTADGIETVADAARQKAVPWFQALGDQAANNERLVGSLGDKVTAVVGAGGQIVLSANDAEVNAKLDALGLKVQTLPDGTVVVTADTAAGQAIIDAFIKSNSSPSQGGIGKSLGISVSANTSQADADLGALLNKYPWLKPGAPPVQINAPTPPSILNPPPGFPPPPGHHAAGGLFSRMPSSAMIQPATPGLVQWAEPSTKGEAYIPLGGGDRSRQIWAETGKRLGVMKMDQGGITSEVSAVQSIAEQFGLKLTSGRRNEAGSYHNVGEAGDFSNGVRTDQELAFATYMVQNFGSELAELIYDDPRFSSTIKDGKVVGPFGAFYTMAQAGNHTNHVHVAVKPGAAPGLTPGNKQLATNVSGSPGSSVSLPGTTTGTTGTAGTGPNGEAGTFAAPDAKDVREAEEKVTTADQRVAEADAKIKELKADAKDSEKIAAQNDLDNAKREAADARTDLDETKKGKFTAGKPDSGKSGGQGGLGQFGGLGDIAGSFLKETFGFDGSFFPDISNLMPVQFASNLLNAFKGPLQGAVDGKLGIQQPGWQPGMPVNGVENDTGIGTTSSSPFGMPDVQVPGTQKLPDAPHGGTGAAPGPVQNIDQSITYNGPVGSDPEAVRKQNLRLQEQRSLPRITGIPQGVGN